MELLIYVVLFILNIPIYKWIFRRIFDDVDDLKQSVKYSFTPDIISLFRRRYWKDQVRGTEAVPFSIFVVY